jgi:hypothetical protein
VKRPAHLIAVDHDDVPARRKSPLDVSGVTVNSRIY